MHDTDNAPPSSALSRRSLLSAAGTLGVAAATGAAGVAVGSTLHHEPVSRADTPRGDATGEPLVVHVRDIADGTMDLFQGMSHHQVRDPELAARLAGLTRS